MERLKIAKGSCPTAISGNHEEVQSITKNMKSGKNISRLALAITLWGWLFFVSWLSYDYAQYQTAGLFILSAF